MKLFLFIFILTYKIYFFINLIIHNMFIYNYLFQINLLDVFIFIVS